MTNQTRYAPPPHDRGDRRVADLSGRDARQGTIIMRKGWQRWLFPGGLAAIAMPALILAYARAA